MKFSIVTPSYNSERFISETIESVISQKGDFEIEYIIMDNCSTDNTHNIAEEYLRKVANRKDNICCKGINIIYKCEQDKGMYDAINKGFHHATGDIYAWINADDIYLPGAFAKAGKVFEKFSEVKWLKGITSYIDETSKIWEVGKCFMYNQKWIQQGVYGRNAYFIQQDSVFWRAELWKDAGEIDTDLKMAGDYSLWIKFAMLTPLYTMNEEVSCFRKVKGQKSQDINSYYKEFEKINIPFKNNSLQKKVICFFSHEKKISSHFLRIAFYALLFGIPKYYLIDFKRAEPKKKFVFYHIISLVRILQKT